MSTETPPTGWLECVGDVVAEDFIQFNEKVWRRGKHVGERLITARVISVDGPGADDWINIQVLKAAGKLAAEVPEETRRKRRTIDRHDPARRPWSDESARAVLVAEADDQPTA